MKAIWKGSLSFGLVNIPVHMYVASKEKEISFVMLHKKDMSAIRYARICKNEEKEVPWEEIIKAYEIDKGDYITLDEKDFDKVNMKKTKTIEIINFINEEEIDPIYFVKPYFLEPDKNAVKAYSLLREALRKSKKVGLAKYVLRNREHLAVLKIHEDMLIMNELRYESELVIPQDLQIPPVEKTEKKELEIALQLIDSLTVPFEPKKYKDTYMEELKEIIKQKSKGKPVHPKEQEKIKATKVQDIMSLLQASLEQKKSKPRKSSKKIA